MLPEGQWYSDQLSWFLRQSCAHFFRSFWHLSRGRCSPFSELSNRPRTKIRPGPTIHVCRQIAHYHKTRAWLQSTFIADIKTQSWQGANFMHIFAHHHQARARKTPKSASKAWSFCLLSLPSWLGAKFFFDQNIKNDADFYAYQNFINYNGTKTPFENKQHSLQL